MTRARRRRSEAARAEHDRLVAGGELGLALEHEERVGVVVVRVRVDDERIVELHLDRADVLEVTELDLEVDGDTFAPSHDGWSVARVEPDDGWSVSRGGIPYRFLTLIRA